MRSRSAFFTSLSGMTAGASLLRVMAKDDALPSVFAKISPKTRVATVATGFVAVLTLALIFIVLPIGMTTGAKISNYGALSTYFMLNIAVIWGLGIKAKILEHGKFWRTIIFPLIGAIVTGVIFCSLGGEVLIVGTVWLVLGIIFYYVWTKALHHTPDLLSDSRAKGETKAQRIARNAQADAHAKQVAQNVLDQQTAADSMSNESSKA